MINESLLRLVTEHANEEYDGHFTLMKFTTNWTCIFGTPTSRTEIETASKGDTPNEAMQKALMADLEGM